MAGLLDALAVGAASSLGSWADEVRRAVPEAQAFRPRVCSTPTRHRVAAAPSSGDRVRPGAPSWSPAAVPANRRGCSWPAGSRWSCASRSPSRPCMPDRADAACPPVDPGHADLLGTGCAQAVTWSGEVLTVAAAHGVQVERFHLGRPGDRLVLGRWACAPRATPALYRPATGEVLVYPSLPGAPGPGTGVEPRRTASGVVAGEPVVVADHRGCDTVVVRR